MFDTIGIVYYHIISQNQRKLDIKLLKFIIDIFLSILSTEIYKWSTIFCINLKTMVMVKRF